MRHLRLGYRFHASGDAVRADQCGDCDRPAELGWIATPSHKPIDPSRVLDASAGATA